MNGSKQARGQEYCRYDIGVKDIIPDSWIEEIPRLSYPGLAFSTNDC